MRIAYLIGEDIQAHSGLYKKIMGQIHHWGAEGHDCWFVEHLNGWAMSLRGERLHVGGAMDVLPGKCGQFSRLLRIGRQYQFAAHALAAIRPDIVYSRYLFPFPGLAEKLADAKRVILEINSDDRSEYYSKHLLTGIYNQLLRGECLRKANGLIFVTNELARSSAFSSYTNRRAVIANSVNIDAVTFVRDPENTRPQICFIGSPGQSWHGLDRLPILAEILPESDFHVIGSDVAECSRIWGCLPGNVIVHGYLKEAEASRLVARMDIGISTLALYRLGMNEACPLKSRQYFSHGTPVISAYTDPDIPDGMEGYLRLPNEADNILPYREDIKGFVRKSFRNTDLRTAIRLHAFEHMTLASKESQRLNFFREILGVN